MKNDRNCLNCVVKTQCLKCKIYLLCLISQNNACKLESHKTIMTVIRYSVEGQPVFFQRLLSSAM